MGGSCDSCDNHQKLAYQTDINSKDIEQLQACNTATKTDQIRIRAEINLLSQKIDNLKYPLWIILVSILSQVGKWLFGLLTLSGGS